MSAMQTANTLALKTTRKWGVIKKLDGFIANWQVWQKEIGKLGDKNCFQPNLDGEENIQHHHILQEKTLAFLDKYLVGHGFICGKDGTHIDRTDCRLNIRVKHRLLELHELRACIEYAEMPAGLLKSALEWIRGLIPEVIAKTITGLIQNSR